MYLNHYCLVWARQCVNVCPRSNMALFEKAHTMDLRAEGPCGSEWIGRFHFGSSFQARGCSKSVSLLSKNSEMKGHIERKWKSSSYPWLYTHFSLWKSPISPQKHHLGCWVQEILSTHFIIRPSRKYCIWLFCQGHRSAAADVLSLWVI